MFSSGVFLALHGGALAADAVDAALDSGNTSAGSFAGYGERLSSDIEKIRMLVHSFYDENFSFGRFIRKYPEFSRDVTDCLIGNIARDFTELGAAVADFAAPPAPLGVGRPLLRTDRS